MLRSKLETYLLAGIDHRFWYEKSNESMRQWAEENGFSLADVANITAIFSPRVRVARNISIAKLYLLTRRLNGDKPLGTMAGAMGQRVRAADEYFATGRVSGVKIQAFAKSLLLDPYGDAVIDVHMSAMVGYGVEMMAKTLRHARKREQWQRIIRKMADRRGWSYWQVQSSLWAGYLKTEKSYDDKSAGAMDWGDDG